jgi:hypothetical protein
MCQIGTKTYQNLQPQEKGKNKTLHTKNEPHLALNSKQLGKTYLILFR